MPHCLAKDDWPSAIRNWVFLKSLSWSSVKKLEVFGGAVDGDGKVVVAILGVGVEPDGDVVADEPKGICKVRSRVAGDPCASAMHRRKAAARRGLLQRAT
jgi:hypothetical protein